MVQILLCEVQNMLEKVTETKKYNLYRDKTKYRDQLIMEDKKTGKRYSMDTVVFIETATDTIKEIHKHD